MSDLEIKDSECVSSYQLLTDNQRDVEQTNQQIMFRRRRRENQFMSDSMNSEEFMEFLESCSDSSISNPNNLQSMRSRKNGIIATTGINRIYEEIDGEKVFTEEYKERYMNEKVEKELVDFKKEIRHKFKRSEVNMTYKFKRTKEYEEEK